MQLHIGNKVRTRTSVCNRNIYIYYITYRVGGKVDVQLFIWRMSQYLINHNTRKNSMFLVLMTVNLFLLYLVYYLHEYVCFSVKVSEKFSSLLAGPIRKCLSSYNKPRS